MKLPIICWQVRVEGTVSDDTLRLAILRSTAINNLGVVSSWELDISQAQSERLDAQLRLHVRYCSGQRIDITDDTINQVCPFI